MLLYLHLQIRNVGKRSRTAIEVHERLSALAAYQRQHYRQKSGRIVMS